MSLSDWCSRIIRSSFYLLFILVPLVLTPWNYELFEYNKMMVTYALSVVIAGAWSVQMIATRTIRVVKTPFDIPLWIFAATQMVSTVFSMDPHVSWMGYYSRFNGGMWSIFTYVFLYHAFVTQFSPSGSDPAQTHAIPSTSASKKKAQQSHHEVPSVMWRESIIKLLHVAVSTGLIVAIYGILERMGIDKHLWVQDVQNRVFSTLGQPNWLAAYLVALLPISMALTIRNYSNSPKPRWLSTAGYGIISLIFFTVLLFTRSRSGLLAFAVCDIVFWIILFFTYAQKRAIKLSIVTAHILFAAIVFFNGSNVSQIDKHFTLGGLTAQYRSAGIVAQPAPAKPTGPALETGGTESGTIRTYVWQGAISAWQSTTKTWMIGTGTETFAYAFYKFRPVEHNNTSEWDFLYNKAHNEYLNYLATTGVFGLLSYLAFIGVVIVWFLKRILRKHDTQHTELTPISVALFAGWCSILITNFFGFSVVIVQILLFILPSAMYLFALTSEAPARLAKRIELPKWTTASIMLLTAITVTRIGLFWYADTLYASAYRDARNGQFVRAKQSVETAILLNPGEPNYHDELATTLASLAVGSYEQQLATQASELARQALDENAKAIAISPLNVNFWKSKTKIYYSFSALNPAFTTESINALTKAQDLSPNDPKITYNLAILYGRTGNSQKAIELLEHAMTIKPNYRDAYYALYVFYTEVKQSSKAKEVLESYLRTIDASDSQFMDLLKQS